MARLNDGYQTLIAFANYSALLFWEKEVTPPGVDGGGEIDTTTMRNDEWRTRQPKALRTLTEMTLTAAYDPAFLDGVVDDLLQENQLITVTFSDGSTWQFWGWLDKFMPQRHVEGEQPTAEITIIPSNQDDNGDEVAPTYDATP